MDDAYVQGHSKGENRAREAFRRRKNGNTPTNVIDKPKVSNIHKLIDYLQHEPSVSRPIGNLIIGAHANAEGLTNLMLFPDQSERTEYETFQKTQGSTARSIAIPDSLLGQTSTDPPSHFVHIKGCNLGRPGNEPLMTLVKAAFGNRVFVTAPKFFNEFVQIFTRHNTGGVFEYMALEFQVSSPKPLGGRDAIQAEFENHPFRFFDGSLVLASDLAKWILQNPSAGPKAIPGIKPVTMYEAKLGTTVAGRETIPMRRELRVEQTPPFPWKVTFSNPGDVPTDSELQKIAVKKDIAKDPRFLSTHPYPFYKRENFADVPAFVDGHSWRFTTKGNVLSATGTRWLYTLLIPIETASGNLVFNFYPDIGSGILQIINIDDTNAAQGYYTQV